MEKLQWVCIRCGLAYGKNYRVDPFVTFHSGICDICGKETSVTEPRDFGGIDLTPEVVSRMQER